MKKEKKGTQEAQKAQDSFVLLVLFVFLSLSSACETHPEAQTAKPVPPAKVDGAVKETDLVTLTLTPEAEKRLGIEARAVERQRIGSYRSFGGEVVVPEGRVHILSSPVAGALAAPSADAIPVPGTRVRKGQPVFRLVPFERDARGINLRADAERELATAEARIEAAQLRVRRAEQLLRDRAGSQRSVEEARAELAQAEAARKGARDQLDYLSKTPFDTGAGLLVESPADGVVLKSHVAAGQTVPAGTAVVEIASLDPVWIRVPIYVGEIQDLAVDRAALVHDVAGTPGASRREARRITGVPTAQAGAATVDMFYEMPNPNMTLRPGQRVGASLALRQQTESLVVPWSAVLHDVNGGAWVYENTAPHTYARRRVEVRFVSGGLAALGRGPSLGAKVVVTGAAELFGTEFGVGK